MRECLTLGPSRCSDRSGAETEGKEKVGKESGELEARNGSLLPFFLLASEVSSNNDFTALWVFTSVFDVTTEVYTENLLRW